MANTKKIINNLLAADLERKETLTKIIERENTKVGNGEGIDNGVDLYDYILSTGEAEATEEECEEVFEEYLKNL